MLGCLCEYFVFFKMFPSLKRLDPGMCGSGTALGNPQEMGGIFGTEGRRKRVRPRKILLGFTVSTGNLNLNPFEEMGFLETIFRCSMNFSYGFGPQLLWSVKKSTRRALVRGPVPE